MGLAKCTPHASARWLFSGVVIGGPLASLQPLALNWTRSRPGAPCINLMCYTVLWRSRVDSVQEEMGVNGGRRPVAQSMNEDWRHGERFVTLSAPMELASMWVLARDSACAYPRRTGVGLRSIAYAHRAVVVRVDRKGLGVFMVGVTRQCLRVTWSILIYTCTYAI